MWVWRGRCWTGGNDEKPSSARALAAESAGSVAPMAGPIAELVVILTGGVILRESMMYHKETKSWVGK